MSEMIINNLSDRDKVIRTLACVKAHCEFKKWTGICDDKSTSKCQFCPTGKRFELCYEQLPDFDKLCVDNLADEMMTENLTCMAMPNRQVDDNFVSVQPPRNSLARATRAACAFISLAAMIFWLVKGLCLIHL